MSGKPKTNVKKIQDMMEFSSVGVLKQVFILQAIEAYSKQVLSSTEVWPESSMISQEVWRAAAKESLQELGVAELEDDNLEIGEATYVNATPEPRRPQATYSITASELGIKPGNWPKSIKTNLGNGTPFKNGHLDGRACIYAQDASGVTLAVFVY